MSKRSDVCYVSEHIKLELMRAKRNGTNGTMRQRLLSVICDQDVK